MKVILENWQQFLIEASLSRKSEFLLKRLVNMKKFGSTDKFLQRTKFFVQDKGDEVRLVITIDGEAAAYSLFSAYEEQEGCRPDPTESMTTYEFKNVARSGSFKGYGIGKLIGFLSVCYINGKMGGSITSDRNTSDKASSQLIKNMSIIGAKKSDSFDYVGWLKTTLKKHMKRMKIEEGILDKFKNKAPDLDPYQDLPPVDIGDDDFKQLLKDLYDHLEPMTAKASDDCQPSFNINFVQFFSMSAPSKTDAPLMQKFLEMSTDQIQAFLDSDERVQGYTFTLPKAVLAMGNEITDAMDATSEADEEEMDHIMRSGDELFGHVYSSEIDPHGRSIT
tara:strand:+ start:158 stop:1162 length:1005 start_codon:yes stop_codon:yes gene_type:complete